MEPVTANRWARPPESGVTLGGPSAPERAGWAVEAEQLVRRFGEVTALAGVSLRIRPGEFFSLLGPSGCGKTTLLRILAGLDLPDSGTLRISGVDSLGLPAHRRPVNTVFQSYALFPHLSVRDNVAFGLRMKGVPASETTRRVGQAMELVEIHPLGDRRPGQLSGGQKQRVALARALVNEPEVLLLDEPLGALDLRLRKQLQVELHALQRRLRITFIHVTHDQDEALAMSDRIAVMQGGQIEQLAEPRALYERPRTRFVAQFLGACNVWEGQVRTHAGHALGVATVLGEFWVSHPATSAPPPVGTRVSIAIRPEKLEVHGPATAPVENGFPASVQEVVYAGSTTEYLLRAGEATLRATTANDRPRTEFAPGAQVLVVAPRSGMIVLED